ncbi:septation protein SepH [Phycicoccus sp. SLBN-51]|uniref:septation protein SepH n=1 Tax=Phycicoccus sp. SLBN-51 TaxID=2768447 RepID=UPI0011748A8E|nr:septation protein SepH [Phycicoccus sp. SLBN-51]TQJ50444.1 DUF3071 family protein [Phycicoccus sp. SLBN-51]
MLELRLIGVHEDGQHLLLADPEGNRYRVPLDEALRAAARRDRPRLGQLQIEIEGGMRPREVQALIRAGASAEEVAERAGWPVEKVRRYEGPILAEREHVAGLARSVRLRGRGGGQGSTPTLATRVSQRLSGRGVDPSAAEWDSARNEEGEWTVTLTFAAGGRQRQASWHFDVPARTVVAADDEARWLSEDDQPATNSPIPAPHLVATPVRATTVYDVEAEGGVAASARPRPSSPNPERPSREEPLDLMTAMRERASARGRRSGGGRRKSAPAQTPVDEAPREDALPLEDIAYDPETMPPPPAARGTHPADEPEAVGDDVMPAAEHDRPATNEPEVEPEAEPEPEPAVASQPEPEAKSKPEPQAEVDVEPQPEAEAEPKAKVEAEPKPEPQPEAKVEPEKNEVEAQETEAQETEAQETEAPRAESGEGEKAEPEQPKPGPARPSRKKGRPSVPSWDDVVFGARPRD